jgi:hypothetical protein
MLYSAGLKNRKNLNKFFIFTGNISFYRALRDLFYLADLSGNAAWFETFLGRERGEEGEWDEWGRKGNVGPLFFRTPSSLPFLPSSLFSPF